MIPLFLHLPKTGGTTFNDCICEQYHRPERDEEDSNFHGGIYYYPHGFFQGQRPPGPDQLPTVLARPDLRAVVGHFHFGIHRFLPPETEFGYLTFLRKPADRIASLYRHIVHFDVPDPDLHREVTGKHLSLHEFASSLPLPELENDQTRRLAGITGPCSQADFELARQRLVEEFTFVGVTEHFDESLLLMKRRLGWMQPLQYYRENVSAEWGTASGALPVGTVQVIEERNRYDLELYQVALELFRQSRRQEDGSGLDEEVAAFRQHNRRMNEEWRRAEGQE